MKTKRIIDLGTKVIYNLDDGLTCSYWVRTEIKGIKTTDEPLLSNPLKISEKQKGRHLYNSIGFMHSNGNDVKSNTQYVGILSISFSRCHAGLPIIPENFDKVVSLFTARKLITANWVNQIDEYSKPNKEILNEN